MRTQRRARKGRPRQSIPKTLPDNLYDYADNPAPPLCRPRDAEVHASDIANMRVVDDWPEQVPVTEAEIRVFERWFADVFDELLSPIRPREGLSIISQTDMKKP